MAWFFFAFSLNANLVISCLLSDNLGWLNAAGEAVDAPQGSEVEHPAGNVSSYMVSRGRCLKYYHLLCYFSVFVALYTPLLNSCNPACFFSSRYLLWMVKLKYSQHMVTSTGRAVGGRFYAFVIFPACTIEMYAATWAAGGLAHSQNWLHSLSARGRRWWWWAAASRSEVNIKGQEVHWFQPKLTPCDVEYVGNWG